jgi:integrase
VPASYHRTSRGRYRVQYRLGGRGSPVHSAGSFRTEREARARRDLVAGELAVGRDPGELLRRARSEPEPTQTVLLRECADQWLESRVDLRPTSVEAYRRRTDYICASFGAHDPLKITSAEVQTWIGKTTKVMKPGSVRKYLGTFATVLDFALEDGAFNAARSRKLTVPRHEKDEPQPPTAENYRMILRHVTKPERWLLPIVLQERMGSRPGELTTATWGDLDRDECRILVKSSREKTRTAKWLDVPPFLMPFILSTCAPEDRVPDRRLFRGLTTSGLRTVLWFACRAASIPTYSPNDLRHRRATLWHLAGVPPAQVAHRMGHARISRALDTYTHIAITAEEVSDEEIEAMLMSPTKVAVTPA